MKNMINAATAHKNNKMYDLGKSNEELSQRFQIRRDKMDHYIESLVRLRVAQGKASREEPTEEAVEPDPTEEFEAGAAPTED